MKSTAQPSGKKTAILTCCSLGALVALLVSLNRVRIAVVVGCFLILCLALLLTGRSLRFGKQQLVPTAAILLFAVGRFYNRWQNASLVRRLASQISLSSSAFLILAGFALALLAFYGLNVCLNALEGSRAFGRVSRSTKAITVVLPVVLFFLELLQLQRSCLDMLGDCVRVRPFSLLLNLGILLLVWLLLSLLSQSRRRGAVLSCCLVALLSIVNYYVIAFHGSPLFPSEFANAKTAMNVLGAYSLFFGPEIAEILGLLLLELYLISRFRMEEPKRRLRWSFRTALLLVLDAAFLYTFLYSPIAVDQSVKFSWRTAIKENGYLCCSAANIEQVLHPIRKPASYAADRVEIPEATTGSAEQLPDIILILNESFCDLSVCSGIETDRDYLAPFYGIENAFYGKAYSPNIGGGTNNTEFELLTSCSMYLLPNYAPFNYIRFTSRNATLPTYLKELGYTTTAMHSNDGTNYSRHIAFPAMGFDHIYMGKGSFSEMRYYGNRHILDEDDFKGLIEKYEADPGAHRFYYLLTFQNHGGYDSNDAALDTVHVTGDLGDMTDEVNEYLSSVALSAEAFKGLTEYFSGRERPVILCMVGDHAPSFIRQIPQGRGGSVEEQDLLMKCVPFAIWANYPVSFPEESIETSMTDLLPLLLSYAGMPETPFYQSVLDVHKRFPVRTSNGTVLDAAGTISQYDENDPRYELIRNYYNMEYNLLTDSEDYLDALTELP